MSTLPFTAHCAAGHDRIDFTDRELFDYHMTVEHKVRKHQPGGVQRTHNLWGYDRQPRPTRASEVAPSAPGWARGAILPPHPHTAPNRAPGGIDRVTEAIARDDYCWPSRWRGEQGPLAAVPAEDWVPIDLSGELEDLTV